MKKFIIVFFSITAVALIGIYIQQTFFKKTEETIQHSRVITPIAPGNVDTQTMNEDTSVEETTLISYIPLETGETLLNAYSVTLSSNQRGDSVDDQICVVRRTGNPYLILLICLYNTTTATYSRAAEIQTKISQVNTFTFSSTDIIGEHKNALVYTGFTNENQTIMEVFLPTIFNNTNISFEKIASISSDGTLTIQEVARSDAYSLGQVNGISFSIIETCPDPNSGENSLDQLQIVYSWNRNSRQYERISQTRITGRMINSKELARILDGTTDTFNKFLDGLWYKTINNGKEIRYIFFDIESNEIICLLNETQEVYVRTTSWMRRNGIAISTENKSMSALSRRFDVTLVAVDEIKVTATDDLRMVIGEDTLWDGNYKKMTLQAQKTVPTLLTETKDFIQTGLHKWTTQDSTVSFSGTSWIATNTSTGNSSSTTGVFTPNLVQGQEIFEFRSKSDSPLFSGNYKPIIEKSEREDMPDVLILQPVKISVSSIQNNGTPIRLERVIQANR